MKAASFIKYPAMVVLTAILPVMAVSCSSTTSATSSPTSRATVGLDPYEREDAVKQASSGIRQRLL
ncbi:MAG: hypothetical protein JWM59_792 [Verrucomicrobiales bacterium]|nr:hypothetical protein [Verrucomicrobiales bacterium]